MENELKERMGFVGNAGCSLWATFFLLLLLKVSLVPDLSWWVIFIPLALPFVVGLVIAIVLRRK